MIFFQNLGCQFLDIKMILTTCKKSEKTDELFLKNAKLRDGQMDWQADNIHFMRPSVGRGPKYKGQ